MPTGRAIHIEVLWRLGHSWRATALLKRVAGHVAAAEGFRTGRLSVVVVGARAMRTLQERYLGRAGPTDVLAFDLGTDRRRAVLDGEVIVCADVARARARADASEARSARRSNAVSRAPSVGELPVARAELALYLTHGILHLAGYDDRRPADFRRMHAREDELLTHLGLGPVFARGG